MAVALRPDLHQAPILRKSRDELGYAGDSPASASPTGSGQALPGQVQAKMERAFGADFSSVRIHQGPEARAMGALAYTQGSRIHFAPGQYDPGSQRGQALLGHELAHVVQQAQGQVSATTQAKGVPVNDDAALEREADEMGARAARGEDVHGGAPPPPGAADERSAPSTAAPGPAQRQSVIQRAVGFEFETGWFVDRVPFESSHDDVELPDSEPVPFSKKDVVSSAVHDGFRLEADEAENGRSELEIVIRPPIEESQDGKERLETIMDAILDIGTKLKSKYNDKEESFSLDTVTGAPFDAFTLVTPRQGDPKLKAGPQVTTGLDLSVIPELLRAKPVQTDHPKFHGFVTLVKQYITRGTGQGGALSYPKIVAEPLLARTNFVKLFALVEPEIQERYVEHKETWVSDILTLANLPLDLAQQDFLSRGVVSDEDEGAHTKLRLAISDKDDAIRRIQREIVVVEQDIDQLARKIKDYREPSGLLEKLSRMTEPTKSDLQLQLEERDRDKQRLVIERAEQEEQRRVLVARKKQLETYAGFTVGRWLEQILEGVDLLPTIKDAESLGEFGGKTEKVGPNGIEAGIFEWRGDQTNKLEVDLWPSYALSFFDKLLKLHGHE